MKTSRVVNIMLAILLLVPSAAAAGTIVDEWAAVQPPAPVELKAVTVNATDTALLVLDIEERTCNMEVRPRCVESAPRIGAFLAKARAAGMPVVHSLTTRGTPESILPPARPCRQSPLSSPRSTNSTTQNSTAS